MNIKQAKEEIKHTVSAYLAKDESGEYRIPSNRQRPVLLMGPPGIGKTQIMEQIARECKIGLVAYTITHHTRQSAVGLPFIKEKTYEGKKYSVTEYTMSEIIASIYDRIEATGLREGILFIDEINCVSETLAPTMLQFLQNKTFGNQQVPKGWIIVAAGNPPEYNKSVREFDTVTLDRVRWIDVEADYNVWKEYARKQHINSAILSYLELYPGNFYKVGTDVDGLQFVTARGWEDLSNLMDVYGTLGLPVNEEIIHEFLHHKETAEDVASYFDLYKKYEDDYGISNILEGKVKPEVFARVYKAAFDERLSVVNLLLDGLSAFFYKYDMNKYITDKWYEFLTVYRQNVETARDPYDLYLQMLSDRMNAIESSRTSGLLSDTDKKYEGILTKAIKDSIPDKGQSAEDSFNQALSGFNEQKNTMQESETEAETALNNAFDFMEKAFEAGEEMVVFVTELTVGSESSAFLSEHNCEKYERYNQELLIGSRKVELLKELNR